MSLTIRASLVIAAVGATAAAALTGCSSDSSGGSSSSPATSASSDSSQPSTSAADSTTATGSSDASGSAQLKAALLSASDLGSGFTAQPSGDDQNDPLPCTPNDPPLFDQVKPTQKVNQQFANSGSTLAVGEDVAVFASGDAQKAFDGAVKGFSCSSGTIGGTKIRIVKRPNSGAQSGDTETAAWDFTDGKQLGTAAVLRIGDKIAAMTFAATKSAANDLNVNSILQKAGTKLAALG